MFQRENIAQNRGQDLWLLPIGNYSGRKPRPFLATEFDARAPRFSPDGKWIAYTSNESGSYKVYVRSLGDRPVKVRVSANGGDVPVWRPDGRELFYEIPGPSVLAVDVIHPGGDQIKFSEPKVLFRGCNASQFIRLPSFDVTTDGKRFLFSRLAEGTTKRSVTVATAWQQALKLPGARP